MKTIFCSIFLVFIIGCNSPQFSNEFIFTNPTSLKNKALDFIRQGAVTVYICKDGSILDISPEDFEDDEIEETKEMIKEENARQITVDDVELVEILYFAGSLKNNDCALITFKIKGTYNEYFKSSTPKAQSSSFDTVHLLIDLNGKCLEYGSGAVAGPTFMELDR